jgi:hypothetical protein
MEVPPTPPPDSAPQYGASMASKNEPNRNSKYDPKKPHITEFPITRQNWYKHVNWLNVSINYFCCYRAFADMPSRSS